MQALVRIFRKFVSLAYFIFKGFLYNSIGKYSAIAFYISHFAFKAIEDEAEEPIVLIDIGSHDQVS